MKIKDISVVDRPRSFGVEGFKIITTELFEKKFYKIIPLDKQEDAKRRINKLKQNPFVGKALGSPYFRELKLQKFRIYFQIFEEEVVVLLISVSDKKQQKEAIKLINEKREELVDYVKNLNKK